MDALFAQLQHLPLRVAPALRAFAAKSGRFYPDTAPAPHAPVTDAEARVYGSDRAGIV